MKEETKLWVEKANKDFERSKLLFEVEDYEGSLFHLQQAIEKFLKAFLIEAGVFDIRRHKTHNIEFLINECSKVDEEFKNLMSVDEAKYLSLAVKLRYPFSLTTRKDIVINFIEIAEKVKEFVLKKLKEKLE
ncbi:MAG: HEPN domain-containing protein [Candidatus Aenigmatarchaeota archaeon]